MDVKLGWIAGAAPGRLAVLPRPRGGDWLDDEIASLRIAGVDVLVSLLTPAEAAELDLVREAEFCRGRGLDFLSFPIEDRGVPSCDREFDRLVRTLTDRIDAGRSLAIHCRMGIGRSAVVAAALLVRRGLSADAAFERIAAARGLAVPDTDEQRGWVARFAEAHRAP